MWNQQGGPSQETMKVVKFQFERASNSSMKERVFESPGPELLDMKLGTVLEVNFENDCYYADFTIENKQVNQLKNNEGTDITEYVYTLKYVPKSTRTKSEQQKRLEEVFDVREMKRLLNP